MTCFEIISIVLSGFAFIVSMIAIIYARKQYFAGIQPDLWINAWGIDKASREVKFDLSNREFVAHINSVKVLSKNLVFSSNPCPYDLEPGESMWLNFIYTGQREIDKDEYAIKIYFSDKAHNSYTGRIKKENGKYIFKF